MSDRKVRGSAITRIEGSPEIEQTSEVLTRDTRVHQCINGPLLFSRHGDREHTFLLSRMRASWLQSLFCHGRRRT